MEILGRRISTLLSKEQIASRIVEVAKQIDSHYHGVKEPLLLVGVLKGSVVFLADLCRAISLPCELEFIGVSSYGEATQSSGVVQITQDLSKPIRGRHVLLVEDIVDTGLTAQYLLDLLRRREPASVKICALLEKPTNNVKQVKPDFLGFTIADHFVVGYGLDLAGVYRNLPFVGVVESDS